MGMVIDSFVCSLAGRLAIKIHSSAGINEKQGDWDLVTIQRAVVLSLNKYTLTCTHTHTNAESSVRSLSFHTDLLSLCNVWYVGIQALLNDLISKGLPKHWLVRLCVCVHVCVFICLRALPLDKTQDLPRQTDTGCERFSQ